MARFFLIDHSLRDTGGHHFDYVKCVSDAADDMGFETIIGTHRKFDSDLLLNSKPVFRNTTYQKDSYLAGMRQVTRNRDDFLNSDTSTTWLRRIKRRFQTSKHKKRRRNFVREFAEDCDRFFRQTPTSEGDHVFFTTVSELEVMGLANYLSHQPLTLQANWHLQFHFNLFDGRTPEYEQQSDTLHAVRSCFDLAAVRIPYHQVHFYVTSEALADQFNRLQVGEFEVLPYPVAPCFRPDQRETNSPLRFTCPGGIRREKKQTEYLQPLVKKIWDKHLDSGKIKLVVQRPQRNLVQGEKIQLELPEQNEEVVEYLPHPLPNDQYAELIRSTDCGLLYYDSRTYFSRRAGIMGELLSCGKPVIVSAGSWLAEQLKEPQFSYAKRLAQSDLRMRSLSIEDLSWGQANVPLPGGVISFDAEQYPFEVEFDSLDDEGGFCVFWNWHWPKQPGVFARIEMECLSESSETFEPDWVQTIGHRENLAANSFFRVQPGANKIRLRFKNAFHHSMASISGLKIVTLSEFAAKLPLSTVGISAADEEQLPACIDEIVEHYQHYRESALKFADQWLANHRPRRTVAKMISVEQNYLRAA